jgi:Cdc6-like AAA superfamily ATPase
VDTKGFHGVLLTGTVGTGKSAVIMEICDLLGERGEKAAAIDLDWLGWTTSVDDVDDLIARNLAAVWPNLRSAGVRYLALARVVPTPLVLDNLRKALPEVELEVVRLVVPLEVVESRLRRRDTGTELEEHLVEAAHFEDIIIRVNLEDHRVDNAGRSVREVALEILETVRWI